MNLSWAGDVAAEVHGVGGPDGAGRGVLISTYIYIYIYIYIYMCIVSLSLSLSLSPQIVCRYCPIHVYIYIYMYSERERERGRQVFVSCCFVLYGSLIVYGVINCVRLFGCRRTLIHMGGFYYNFNMRNVPDVCFNAEIQYQRARKLSRHPAS